MPILTEQQVAQLAYQAGFRGDDIKMAVAIAKAESGFNTQAYNPEIAAGTAKGSGSRGLWQIYGAAHPQYNSNLAFDPVVNARAAYEVFKEMGGKFTPWSTFNNGSAQQYYNQLNLSLPDGGDTQSSSLRIRTDPVKAGYEGMSGAAGLSSLAGQLQQTNQSIQDIASGKFITNIFSKVDTESVSFYVGGLLLIGIGLLVIFARPASQLVISTAKAGTQAAVAGAL